MGASLLALAKSIYYSRGIHHITPHYNYSLSEKLVAALTVTGEFECRAETITDNKDKSIQYIFPLLIFPSTCLTVPVKQHMNLPDFLGLHFLRRQLS